MAAKAMPTAALQGLDIESGFLPALFATRWLHRMNVVTVGARHQRTMRSMANLSGTISSEVAAFLLPPQILVGPSSVNQSASDKVLDQLGLRPTQAIEITREIHQRFREATESAGIRTFDLFDAFAGESASTLYDPEDGHLTPAGHRVASEYMFKVLRQTVSRRERLYGS